MTERVIEVTNEAMIHALMIIHHALFWVISSRPFKKSWSHLDFKMNCRVLQ